ncbi:MAG: hypothetical protein ACSHX6_07285 [Akkermansiaceae bacterium]
MARRNQSNERKLELLSQLDKNRKDITVKKQVLVQQIDESKQQLKEKINVPKRVTNKVKSSFASSPTKWFIGSAVGGLIISKLFFGTVGSVFKKPKQQEKVSRGLLFTLAGLAIRPMVKSFLIGKAKDYVTQRFLVPQQPQPHQVSYHDEYNSDNRY